MYTFPDNWRRMPVTLCHDWLTGMRGGERVLEILCEGFPSARILTLLHNPRAISECINSHEIVTSCLQRVPGIHSAYRNWLPLLPAALRTLPPPADGLVISTSHCVAKSIRHAPEARHLCYCFTPMRYAWTFFDEYFGSRPLTAIAARPLLAALRRWDRRTSSRVDRFVGISRNIRGRIERFYGRTADVVYPPVDTDRCTPGAGEGGDYDLVVSALVPYKRVDLAVRAYTTYGFPLRVVGVGGELDRLKRLAGPNVAFLEWRPDAEVVDLYRGCRLLVFPGEEDFGIVPLEAQSCGRPVVAYGRGGALETVLDGRTGVFFAEQTENALLDGVRRAAAMSWNAGTIRAHAETFGVQHFIDGLDASIEKCLSET